MDEDKSYEKLKTVPDQIRYVAWEIDLTALTISYTKKQFLLFTHNSNAKITLKVVPNL